MPAVITLDDRKDQQQDHDRSAGAAQPACRRGPYRAALPCPEDIETGSCKAQQPEPLFTFGNWQRCWEHRYLEVWKTSSFDQHKALTKDANKQKKELHELWGKLGALGVVRAEQQQQQQQQEDIECGAPSASPGCAADFNAWAILLPNEPLHFGSHNCKPGGLYLTEQGGEEVIATLAAQLSYALIAARWLLEARQPAQTTAAAWWGLVWA